MLRVQGLVRRFGNKEVLRGVDFAVAAGRICGLLGANGAGKSTVINIIVGLLTPDAGVVTIAAEPSARGRRQRLGHAPQEIALYPALSCEENVRFFGRLYGLRGVDLQRRVERVLERTGLAVCRRERTASLSGGWKRRLNLAVALVHEPAVLLLDEPTAGLDVEARAWVWQLLRDLAEQGCALLLTTHLLDEAETLCHHVAILAGGRVAAQGTLEDLRRLVPARELAGIACDDEQALRTRAKELGLAVRRYDGRLTLLLPERTTVMALADRLGEVGLRAIALEAVGLRHVYLQVGGAAGRAGRQDGWTAGRLDGRTAGRQDGWTAGR
jgi:ABC-2 type transport system ATP-binding protein